MGNVIIIYTKHCLSCVDKSRWKQLRVFAAKHGLKIEQRRVGIKKEWQQDAEQYDIDLPFVVNGKIALSLSEPLERLLK